VDGKKGLLSGIKTFCVECFSIRFYWYMFGITAFSAMAGNIGIFTIFFVKDIGLDTQKYGNILAYCGIVTMCLTYPAGLIADKYHPLRVQLAMKFLLLFFTPLYLAFAFVKMDPKTAYYYYMAVAMCQIPASALYVAAVLPAIMRLFPKERYGQFCSADALVRSVGTMFGGLMAGATFDFLKWVYHGDNFAYRWIFAWSGTFDFLAFLCLIKVYYGWKKYGGLKNYVPPMPDTTGTPKVEGEPAVEA
jgi:predicted MFS family arabinose efflux permease